MLPAMVKLRDGTTVRLDYFREKDFDPLHALFNTVVKEGTSYPQDHPLSAREFELYWLIGKTAVVVKVGPQVAGSFYLKPNLPGRSAHIANAGFIVAPGHRCKGLGHLLGETMLALAKEEGYRGVIFNLVFAENQHAAKLWQELGFKEIGRIPDAVRKNDGSYQDAIIMFRKV
jgi:ribosomal protein S18 acetylase RimI-like enzyme